MVLVEGFAWNGNTYPSLSKVARAITGTRWNGPRFFGLRDQQDREDDEASSEDAPLCRLYPRSTDYRLEQDFNSLDAQGSRDGRREVRRC